MRNWGNRDKRRTVEGSERVNIETLIDHRYFKSRCDKGLRIELDSISCKLVDNIELNHKKDVN